MGPSLTDADRAAIDRDVFDVHPPIRRGELAEALQNGYRTIAIIDGEFYQSLAVSPKEILIALRDDAAIIGGASMGALRAAEMDTYGMQGAGKVYEWYRKGVVFRDDDVALLYGSADTGSYQPITVPMVNVRWLIEELKRQDVMTGQLRRRISMAARSISWRQRTWPAICAKAGIDASTAGLDRWTRDPAHDRKRLDALEVLAVAESHQTP